MPHTKSDSGGSGEDEPPERRDEPPDGRRPILMGGSGEDDIFVPIAKIHGRA